MDSVLFSPVKVGKLTIMNRFMRSPCYMNSCDENGLPSPALLKYYQEMADGKMGLIIPEYLYLLRHAKATNGQGGISEDWHADAWKSTVEYVHRQGSKIIFQVADAGVSTTKEITGHSVRGASPLLPGQREMTKLEIAEVIEAYRDAALRLQRIGVDGIQIHCAHGYLISQFLSPFSNKRTDKYGGSPENRRRILKEIVSSIKEAVSPAFAITVKINGHDCIPGGIVPEDLAETVSSLKNIDMYEVSCGFRDARTTIRSKNKNMILPEYPLTPGYTVDYARVVKNMNPNATLAVVGGNRVFKEMESVIQSGVSDLISLGRPTISEPNIVKNFMEGSRKAKCVSCGQCIIKAHDEPVKCWL